MELFGGESVESLDSNRGSTGGCLANSVPSTGVSSPGHPGTQSAVTFLIKNQKFNVPHTIALRPSFQNSHLGRALNCEENKYKLPDGTLITRLGLREYRIDREDAADFAMMIDHVLGRRPLEVFGFSTIIPAWRRLLHELRQWDMLTDDVELPHLLWTNSRWTDLVGMYALDAKDAELLKPAPVALQLEDGHIQCVRILKKVWPPRLPTETDSEEEFEGPVEAKTLSQTTTTADADAEVESAEEKTECAKQTDLVTTGKHKAAEVASSKVTPSSQKEQRALVKEIRGMLPVDAKLSHVAGVFKWQMYKIVLLRSSFYPKSSAGLSPGGGGGIIESTPVAAGGGGSGDAGKEKGDFLSRQEVDGELISTILVKHPSAANKVVAYDLPVTEKLYLPDGQNYPLSFRLYDRHIYVLSEKFALEVNEMKDSALGSTKIRCGTVRNPAEIGLNRHNTILGSAYTSSSTASASTSGGLMSVFGAISKPKKGQWKCHHPTLGVKYTAASRGVKDLSDVDKVRFFPWGALFTSKTASTLFAVLTVELENLRRVYGDYVHINVKNIPYFIEREDLDVTCGPELDRVYLCCFNQIASNAVIAQSQGQVNKLDFELSSTMKLKLVHMDVPEGAPSGPAFGSLNCLGVLSEFDVAKNTYFQSKLSRSLCPCYES